MPSAPLIPLTLVGPGFAGLNKQQSGSIMPPAFAVEATNCVFDEGNRLASRKGWTAVTSTPISGTPDISQVFEYKPLPGSSNRVVVASNNKLYNGTTALSDVTGAVSVSANNWKFVNFNGKVYGLQASHALIEWSGSGNFANTTAASGSVPNGNELLGSFGRLWGVKSDKQTIQYSGLLDATNWGGAGSGSINLTGVWPNGNDDIEALASFNNFLVVFGKKNIILLTDGTGSAIGIDPTNIYVADIIGGIGCIARDSVQNINGDDLVFLSYNGVMSLNRLIQERSNPIRDISANIRDYLKTQVTAETMSLVRSAFVPTEGLYLLLFPTLQKIFAFDTKVILENGAWRVTEWDTFIPKSLACLEDGKTLYCGKSGKLFQYTGTSDDGASYRMVYRSGWLDLGSENPQANFSDYLKILKRLACVTYLTGATTLVFKWGFDFRDDMTSFLSSTTVAGTGAEWGVGEWGLGEFGGSLGLREFEIPTSGAGQFIRIGVEAEIISTTVAVQHLQLFAKRGRMT